MHRHILFNLQDPDLAQKTARHIVRRTPEVYGDFDDPNTKHLAKASYDRVRYLKDLLEKHPEKFWYVHEKHRRSRCDQISLSPLQESGFVL